MVTFESITENVLEFSDLIVTSLESIFYIIGIAFLLGSIIQYRQHRDNPVAVPISRPILLFILGGISAGFPFILHYLQKVL